MGEEADRKLFVEILGFLFNLNKYLDFQKEYALQPRQAAEIAITYLAYYFVRGLADKKNLDEYVKDIAESIRLAVKIMKRIEGMLPE